MLEQFKNSKRIFTLPALALAAVASTAQADQLDEWCPYGKILSGTHEATNISFVMCAKHGSFDAYEATKDLKDGSYVRVAGGIQVHATLETTTAMKSATYRTFNMIIPGMFRRADYKLTDGSASDAPTGTLTVQLNAPIPQEQQDQIPQRVLGFSKLLRGLYNASFKQPTLDQPVRFQYITLVVPTPQLFRCCKRAQISSPENR